MTWARYVRAVNVDRPLFLYPLGTEQASAGATPNMFRNFAPRRAGGDLVVVNGTPAPGMSLEQIPLPERGPAFFSTEAQGMRSASTVAMPTDLTMEAWVRFPPTGTPGQSTIFGLSTSSNPWTGLRYFSGNWEGFIGDTVGNARDIVRIALDEYRGTWIHLVATYNGTTRVFRMFLNGVERGVQGAAGTGTRDTTARNVYINRYNATYTSYFPTGGGIRAVAAYDKFDPTLAARHYQAALARGEPL